MSFICVEVEAAAVQAAPLVTAPHPAVAHYLRPYDFALYANPPTKRVMLGSIPRSGSTALGLAMWRTGVLGAPLEYLNAGLMRNVGRWKHLYEHSRVYWREVQSVRTSPNGVFSFKMFPSMYFEAGELGSDFLECIAFDHVVYLTRRDRVGQAISLSRAHRTSVYFKDAKREESVEYRADHIASCEQQIESQLCFWEKAFEMIDTDVIRITYEDFLEDRDAVIDHILERVNGNTYRASLKIEDIGIQRDEVTAIWHAQYGKWKKTRAGG